MRGGLMTTDLDGGLMLLNRTAEEITGYRFEDVPRKIAGRSDSGDLADHAGRVPKACFAQRKEVEMSTADGQQRYLGLSVSPLRTGERRTSGYRHQFSGPH